MLVVVGWPGQWVSTFTRDAAKGIQITAGQELTHLRLKPGEEIRTPLMVLQFWKGADTVRAQEPLASLDDGPQHAAPRWQADSTRADDVYLGFLSRHEEHRGR